MIIVYRLIDLFWPAIHLAGLLVTIRYFRRHSRSVFLLLLIYFALGVYSTVLAPHVNKLVRRRYTSQITQEQIEKHEAYSKESEELYIKHFGTTPGYVATAVQRVSIPFGQVLLVIALFLFGKTIGKSDF